GRRGGAGVSVGNGQYLQPGCCGSEATPMASRMFRTALVLVLAAGFLAAAAPLSAADNAATVKGLVVSSSKNAAPDLNGAVYTLRTDASTGAGNQLMGGRGSSFQFPFWAAALPHYANNGDQIAYWACGSGCGKSGLLGTNAAGVTVDTTLASKFAGSAAAAGVAGQRWSVIAGSDAPLSASEYARANAIGAEILTLPLTIGEVTVDANINSCTAGNLQLTPSQISEIYLKHITVWNDARLVANNPCLAPESTAISTLARCDSSGTTFVFTDFLTRSVGAPWAASQTISPPASIDGCGSGNVGLAQKLVATPGGIAYVELDQAIALGLKYAAIQNSAGAYVKPSAASGQAAADAASPSLPRAQDSWTGISIAWAPGSDSYPVTTFTYDIVIGNPYDVADGANNYRDVVTADQYNAAKSVLAWMVTDGQQFLPTGFVALTPSVQALSLHGIERMNYGAQQTFTVGDRQTNGYP